MSPVEGYLAHVRCSFLVCQLPLVLTEPLDAQTEPLLPSRAAAKIKTISATVIEHNTGILTGIEERQAQSFV